MNLKITTLLVTLMASACAPLQHKPSDISDIVLKPRIETRTEREPADYMYTIITETYDPTGKLQKRVLEQPNRSNNDTVTVFYDSQGRQVVLVGERGADKSTIEYQRDSEGRIAERKMISQYDGTTTIDIELYDPDNRTTGTEKPSGLGYRIDSPVLERISGEVNAEGVITEGVRLVFYTTGDRAGRLREEDRIKKGRLTHSSDTTECTGDPSLAYTTKTSLFHAGISGAKKQLP